MTPRERILAYAQLMRLPNVFTLIADVAMALCVIAASELPWQAQVFLMLGSICFYLGGMVSNDFFDRKADATTQRHRPIPSGRVKASHAGILMVVLFALGWVLITLAHQYFPRDPMLLGLTLPPILLFVCIVLYNTVLKHTPIGPIAMGGCRFFNILMILYFGKVDPNLWHHIAGIVGLYIVGITWFSRAEDQTSQRWQLVAAAMVQSLAVVLMVLLPLQLPRGSVPVYYLFLTGLFVLMTAGPILNAIATPSAKLVQVAVKSSILALILMDATLATAFVGWYGLLLILLLIPATRLGRWVYST